MSEAPSLTEKVEELKLNDDFVDPWNVASSSDAGVDYDKLIGSEIILFLQYEIAVVKMLMFHFRTVWLFKG